MTDRLTDDQVAAHIADYDDGTTTNALAREVQECRALRPTCPTCNGQRWTAESHSWGDPYGVQVQCDCEDGKMPLAEWVALLSKTLRAARHDVAGGWESINAVLKMAGVS